MLKGGLAALVLLASECLMGAHELVLVLTAGICIAVAAFSTIGIKWKVNENDPENRMS